MSVPTAPVIGVSVPNQSSSGSSNSGSEPTMMRLELRGLAVIGDIDALAGLFVLLRAAVEGEALDMDEHAGDLQPVAAARMHADAAVLMLDANARRRIGRLLALVAKAVAHGGDRLGNRDQPLELFGLDQQRHLISFISKLYQTCGINRYRTFS